MIDIWNEAASISKKMLEGITRIMICGILIVSLLIPTYVKAQQADAISASYNATPSQYKPYVAALGHRLLKAGKERITATGYLAYAENPDKPARVEIVWQYPLKVRLVQDDSSLSFDMTDTLQKVPADLRLAETIEVLLEDSTEGLLSLRSGAIATRHYGSRYKLAGGDSKAPGIDVVQAIYADVFRSGKQTVKTYWFSSSSKLLGFVGYQSASGADISIVIDDWRDVGGEKVPFSIERWENGKLTMRLILSSATVTAAVEDGTFGGN